MIKSNKSKSHKIPLIVLMLSSLIWVSGCSSTAVKIKPATALTVPIEKLERDNLDTPRTLLIKFEKNSQAIDEANKLFQLIRNQE